MVKRCQHKVLIINLEKWKLNMRKWTNNEAQDLSIYHPFTIYYVILISLPTLACFYITSVYQKVHEEPQ